MRVIPIAKLSDLPRRPLREIALEDAAELAEKHNADVYVLIGDSMKRCWLDVVKCDQSGHPEADGLPGA